MSRKKYDDVYSYEVFDDGFDIYVNDRKVIVQHGDFGKPKDLTKSYEENAILMIEDLKKVEEDVVDMQKMKADMDFMALMLDVTLPSEEEEE